MSRIASSLVSTSRVLRSNVRLNRSLAFAAVALLFVSAAHATNAGLPWEGGLNTLKASITGPVAGILSILAVMATGGLLAFGGELNDITKKAAQVVLAMGFTVGAVNVASLFTGNLANAAGAEITTVASSVSVSSAIDLR